MFTIVDCDDNGAFGFNGGDTSKCFILLGTGE